MNSGNTLKRILSIMEMVEGRKTEDFTLTGLTDVGSVYSLEQTKEDFKKYHPDPTREATGSEVENANKEGFFESHWIAITTLDQKGDGWHASSYGRYGNALEYILNLEQNSRPDADLRPDEGEKYGVELKTSVEGRPCIHLFQFTPTVGTVDEKILTGDSFKDAVLDMLKRVKNINTQTKKLGQTTEYRYPSTTYATVEKTTNGGLLTLKTVFNNIENEDPIGTIQTVYGISTVMENMNDLKTRLRNKFMRLFHFRVEKRTISDGTVLVGKSNVKDIFRFTNLRAFDASANGNAIFNNFVQLVNSGRITIEYTINEDKMVNMSFLIGNTDGSLEELYGVEVKTVCDGETKQPNP